MNDPHREYGWDGPLRRAKLVYGIRDDEPGRPDDDNIERAKAEGRRKAISLVVDMVLITIALGAPLLLLFWAYHR